MPFPELTTTSLHLKEVREEHRGDLFEIFSNPDVVKYYDLDLFTDPSQSDGLISLYRNRFTEGVGIRWGIFLDGNEKCIGTCGFNSWSKPMRSAAIGYELNRSYWGKGITTEALYAIIDLAFSGKLECEIINRVHADTIPGNVASEKVLQKLGFVEEGLRRQSGYWKGQYHDLKCFGLLREAFKDPI